MVANFVGYDELAEFIAKLDPKRLLEWNPSETVQHRVEDLIYKKKNNIIIPEESYELDRYMALEYLISLSKARARKQLA